MVHPDMAVQVWIWNARVRIAQLAGGLRDLALYGPMKPAAEQGIDEVRARRASGSGRLILCSDGLLTRTRLPVAAEGEAGEPED